MEAVTCGWLPEQIEAVSSKYALEDHLPPLEDVSEWIDILIARQCRAKASTNETAMALAFGKALSAA